MRICKNKITDHIRDLFSANPLRIPESRIKPMCLIEIVNKKPIYLGQFKYLLKEDLIQAPTIKSSTLTNISKVKTKKINFKLGFKIMENFLKAFGLDAAVVSSAIKNSSTLAFSFENVERLYIEPIELGKILSDNNLIADTNNFMIKEMNGRSIQLALITDVIRSNNFSLATYKDNSAEIDINIPLIQEYITDTQLNLEIETTAKNEIKFIGAEALTFAFSCLEINIDADNGHFSRGEWVNNLRAINPKGTNKETAETSDEWNKLIIDDNEFNLLLLEL